MSVVSNGRGFKSPFLQFDSNVESGNFDKYIRRGEYQYDIYIKKDPNSKVSLWFNFQILNMAPGHPYVFTIFGLNKQTTSYALGQRVLVKSQSHQKWQKLPFTQQYYYMSQAYQFPLLSFVFQTQYSEWHQFAFNYPYTYTQLLKLQQQLLENQLLEVQSLGQSFLKRNIPLFISRAKYAQRPHVLITSRCHCGETPGGFIMHGIIQYLLSDSEKADFLRENVHFHLVPMLNVDGTVLGHYRGNGNGVDMNRGYSVNQQSDILQPEVGCLKKYLAQFTQDGFKTNFEDSEINKLLYDQKYVSNAFKNDVYKENKLDIVVDLHSHSSLSHGLIFYNSVQYQEQQDESSQVETNQVINVQISNINTQQDDGVDYRRDEAGLNFIRALNKKCKTFQYYNDKNIPGSLRKGVFNSFFQRYKEGAPHIFGLEISNSHGYDPQIEGDGEIIDFDDVECYDEGEPQIQVQYMTDETVFKEFKSYTPKDYILMGHKILESISDIYQRANH